MLNQPINTVGAGTESTKWLTLSTLMRGWAIKELRVHLDQLEDPLSQFRLKSS